MATPRPTVNPEPICFYGTADPFGEFSNFAAFPIRLDGRRWPTVEHYFQAQKFRDAAHQNEIRRLRSPRLAARAGRSRKWRLRPDWESAKDAVMRKAIIAKFTQHDDLTSLLLSTGDALLIEHTASDAYWGDGGDGRGKNRLGQVLMEVRSKLRDDSSCGSTR